MKTKSFMDFTQAVVVLKNGKRKYGTVMTERFEGAVKFIPSIAERVHHHIPVAQKVENIPVEQIVSIDVFLK